MYHYYTLPYQLLSQGQVALLYDLCLQVSVVFSLPDSLGCPFLFFVTNIPSPLSDRHMLDCIVSRYDWYIFSPDKTKPTRAFILVRVVILKT